MDGPQQVPKKGRKFAMRPARRGGNDSQSEDDGHDLHARLRRQEVAELAAAEEVENSISSLFPPLETMPVDDEPETQQPDDDDDVPPVSWDLMSERERASYGPSDGEDNNEEDAIFVGGIEAQPEEPVQPESPPSRPKRKRRRTAKAAQSSPVAKRSRGRRQGLGVTNVVEQVSAAMAKARPIATMERQTRAAQRKEQQEKRQQEEEVEPPQDETIEEAQEQVQEDREVGEAREEDAREEEKEQEKEVEEVEEEVEEPPPKTPRRQTRNRRKATSATPTRTLRRVRQGQPSSQNAATIGGEGEEADINNEIENETQQEAEEVPSQTIPETSQDTAPSGSVYDQSEAAEESDRSRPTRTAPRRVAKRKRSKPQSADDNSEEENEMGESVEAQEPEAVCGLLKIAFVSTKTAAAIAQLMGSVGWTGKLTWKMGLRSLYTNPNESGPSPVTRECRELLALLAYLDELYTAAPHPGPSDQDIERQQSDLRAQEQYLWQKKEQADSYANNVSLLVTVICDETLQPLAGYATNASRENVHSRAVLADDLLVFVIPRLASLLQTAYALGGRMPDEELDPNSFYVPCDTVQLTFANWHAVSRVANWLARLEGALAYELGYRAERDILGRYRYLEDSDYDDDRPYPNTTRNRRNGRAPRNRLGRRSRLGSDRTRPRQSLSGEAVDAVLYEPSPAVKRLDRCRLKPLLNQLQDEICRARIDLERSVQRRPQPVPGDDGEANSEADSNEGSWVPVEIAAAQKPQTQGNQEQQQRGERLEIELPVTEITEEARVARNNQRVEGEEGDDLEDDIQDEPLMTPAIEAARQIGFFVESVASVESVAVENAAELVRETEKEAEARAEESRPRADAMQAEAPEAVTASQTPEVSQGVQAMQEVQVAAAEVVEAPAASPGRVVETFRTNTTPTPATPTPRAASQTHVSPAKAAPVVAAPARSPPTTPAPAPSTAASTGTSQAYTKAELKTILVRLRKLRGTAQLDLVRLAADFGRDVYDVASRVEAIKNAVRATALKDKKPVPHWAQAGYLIR
ncbi:hypothetical protein SEUCBS140593_004889 [Sporothrix eucalyptigena]|uniref:Uncharacterized protein n=1 Tax=Sporothrix eucalyptigena TaxID=1812306 RepID=A0ABP0BRQ7_9PEZI